MININHEKRVVGTIPRLHSPHFPRVYSVSRFEDDVFRDLIELIKSVRSDGAVTNLTDFDGQGGPLENGEHEQYKDTAGWCVQKFLIFIPTWGNDPI